MMTAHDAWLDTLLPVTRADTSSDVILNVVQRDALSWYFNNDNHDGDDWPLADPVSIVVRDGLLCVGGCWLWSDGEWSMSREER
jgi:hypothetical protein